MNVQTMDLADVNEALEAAGLPTKKRVDHARIALQKAIDDGVVKGAKSKKEPKAAKETKEAKPKAVKEAKPKAVKEAKPKKEKIVKEPVKRNWDSKDGAAGFKVFTSRGKGVIKANDADAGRYLVEIDGDEYDMKHSSCHFKAVDERYRGRYAVDKENTTVSGKPSIGVEDDLTEALKGMASLDLQAIAKDNEIDFSKYRHLNAGMQRMTVGNILRARLKKGETVKIQGDVIGG